MYCRSINSSRRELSSLSCGTGNPIDDCWCCDPDWETNRKRLADYAIGFGRNALGGKNGRFYVIPMTTMWSLHGWAPCAMLLFKLSLCGSFFRETWSSSSKKSLSWTVTRQSTAEVPMSTLPTVPALRYSMWPTLSFTGFTSMTASLEEMPWWEIPQVITVGERSVMEMEFPSLGQAISGWTIAPCQAAQMGSSMPSSVRLQLQFQTTLWRTMIRFESKFQLCSIKGSILFLNQCLCRSFICYINCCRSCCWATTTIIHKTLRCK